MDLWLLLPSNVHRRSQFAGVTQLVESQPSKLLVAGSSPVSRSYGEFGRQKVVDAGIACVAQLVEHFLGKEEVTGSIPVASSVANSPTHCKEGLCEKS